MTSSTMRDVVVVGAGPAGLYTAFRVANDGLNVILLEEHEELGVPTHCSGIVSGETNRLYKVPDDVVLSRPSACLVISPGGRIAELEDPGEEIAVLDRAGFDRALAASVLEAGGVIRTGCRVDHIRNGERSVEVETSHGERLRARALVLACGVTYRFHPLLGSRLPSPILHTAQMELAASPADKLEVHVGRQVAPEEFAWLVPFRRDDAAYVKTGVLLRGDARAYLEKFLARPSIASRLQESPGEPIRRLMPEIRTSRRFRDCLARLSDDEWDTLVTALASDDVQALIKRKAMFNWHGPLIRSMVKQPGIKSILLRSLFR